jgi:Holliday junction resolvasome RuvABC endonuclease subunit
MPKEPLKILAIIPGTRYLGLAIFYGPQLRDWRIKDIREKRLKGRVEKAKKILSYFIARYEPQVLALKKLNPSRSSANLNQLIAKIKELAKKENLKLYQYSIEEIKAFFSEGKRLNKKGLAEKVAQWSPVLLSALEREKENKNSYHIRVFEAAALGLICFYKLDKT